MSSRKPTYAERTLKALWHIQKTSKKPTHVSSVHAQVRKDMEDGNPLGPQRSALVTKALKTFTNAGLLDVSTLSHTEAARRRSDIGYGVGPAGQGYLFSEAGKKHVVDTRKRVAQQGDPEGDEARLWQAVSRHYTTLGALQGRIDESDQDEEEEVARPATSRTRRRSLAVSTINVQQPPRKRRTSMPNLSGAAAATNAARVATPRPSRRLSGISAGASRTPAKGKRKRMESVNEDDNDSDYEHTPKAAKRANATTPSRRKLDLQRVALEKLEAELERKAKELDDRELEVVEREDELAEAPYDVFGGDMMDLTGFGEDVRDDATDLATPLAESQRDPLPLVSSQSGLQTPPYTSPPDVVDFQAIPHTQQVVSLETHLRHVETIIGVEPSSTYASTLNERRQRNILQITKFVDAVKSLETILCNLRLFASDHHSTELFKSRPKGYFEEDSQKSLRAVLDKLARGEEAAAEVAELRERITELTEEQRQYQEALDQAIDRQSRSTETANATHASLQAGQNGIEALSRKLQILESCITPAPRTEGDDGAVRGDLQQANAAHQLAINRAQLANEELVKAQIEVTLRQILNAKLNEQITALTKEVNELKDALEHAASDLQEQTKTAEAAQITATQSIESLKAELKKSQESSVFLEQSTEMAAILEDLKTAEAEVAESSAKLEQLRKTNESLRQTNDALVSELATTKSSLVTSQDEVQELKSEQAETSKALADVRLEFEETLDSKIVAECQVETLKAEVEVALNAEAAARQEIGAAVAELDTARSELAELRTAAATAADEKSSIKAELLNAKAELESSLVKLQAVQQKQKVADKLAAEEKNRRMAEQTHAEAAESALAELKTDHDRLMSEHTMTVQNMELQKEAYRKLSSAVDFFKRSTLAHRQEEEALFCLLTDEMTNGSRTVSQDAQTISAAAAY